MDKRSAYEIEQGLAMVRSAPRDEGVVRLIVRRPGSRLREVLDEAELDVGLGLVGDDWINRPASKSDRPSPYAQVTLMNARFTELIAGDQDPDSWAQAGDQLYLDLDISQDNLPAGTQLAIGTAVIAMSVEPHTGCASFSERFGSDALRATNTTEGRALRLRGANATIVRSGIVRRGDSVRRA